MLGAVVPISSNDEKLMWVARLIGTGMTNRLCRNLVCL